MNQVLNTAGMNSGFAAHAENLLASFNLYAPTISTLSLDCFDTLIWRRTVTPIDVFFDLQHRNACKKHGISASLRIQAESHAREMNRVVREQTEVNLREIYQSLKHTLSQQEIDELIEDEIEVELAACYAFWPVVELIRHAHHMGKKIIIVSDTYFSKTQLTRILKKCIPMHVFDMIGEIVCSNEYGYSKSQGLFKLVLNKLHLSGNQLLHIGDNLIADVNAAMKEDMPAIHFKQYHAVTEEIFRMYSVAASLFCPDIRHTRAMINLYKPLLANNLASGDNPEKFIGFTILGPILYTFLCYLQQEVAALKNKGKNPKLLFLMRDGYLPALGFKALNPDMKIYHVRISRFVAIAVSFHSKREINEYLLTMVKTKRYHDICHQLLLPENMKNDILAACVKADNSTHFFVKLIHEEHVLQTIMQNSTKFRQRLLNYLKVEADISPEDTLVFVDLGYYCTTQRILQPILQEEGFDVIGRYLISLNSQLDNSRAGLIDSTWCDERAANTLVSYIALLEQFCTEDARSVVDYDEAGKAVFSETGVSKVQNKLLHVIQEEALHFVTAAQNYFNLLNIQFSPQELRDTTVGYLGRFLFLPTQQEINYFEKLKFELNLGTNDLLKMVDQKAGLERLRRRGLFFMQTTVLSKKFTTNFPSEIRAVSMELALAFLTHHRYAIDLNLNDLSLRREALKLIIVRGAEFMQSEVYAQPTYDGYFAVLIPAESREMQIGVVFGAAYKWLQLDCVEAIKMDALYSDLEDRNSQDIMANLLCDQMVDRGAGMYECLSETALAILSVPESMLHDKVVFRLVFRPLTKYKVVLPQQHTDQKVMLTVK